MKALRTLAFASLIAVASPAMAQQNAATPALQLRTGHLQCGAAQLSAETHYLDLPDHDRQVLAQTLSLKNTATGNTKRLAHDARTLQQPFLKNTPVLDASVTGWTCLEGRDGAPYLYVAYTCIESPSRPKCVGTLREWARLFDATGKPLNAHAPRAGKRTPELMKKLGLGRFLSEGVALQDIDE